MTSPTTPDFAPRVHLAIKVLMVVRWPLALVLSTGFLGWVIATDDEMVLKGPIRVQLLVDQPLPVRADVSRIATPIQAQPLRATVTLPAGVRVVDPLAVEVPQLQQPLRADVSGAVAAEVRGQVAAQVSGSVDAKVDGGVEVEIIKPIQHERIRVGL